VRSGRRTCSTAIIGRYIARPPIATGRLSLTSPGQVRYTLKTPYRDGTTHVVFEPLDCMARLAALVPTITRHAMICRVLIGSTAVLECGEWPPVAWLTTLLAGRADAAP